jgi:ABC-2 type transport system ATP-binding protein
MSAAIRAQGLRKRYGDTQVLQGLDLTVESGQVLGLLGPNGAGKTTIIRILATLLDPDEGEVEIAGYNLRRSPREIRRRIGLTGQYAAVDELLTGRENLRLIGTLLKLGRRAAAARADELLEKFELTDAANRPARTYSGGMRRRLDLAASLVSTPVVLFLDEPTTGLDVTSRKLLWRMVIEQVAQGVTVLLTTQYLEEADALADRIVVIDHGRIIANDTPAELKRTLGGERLEISVADASEVAGAYDALRWSSEVPPTVDEKERRVAIPLTDGVRVIAEVSARLHAAGIEPIDFAVRRSSLDDVFVMLTQETPEGVAV